MTTPLLTYAETAEVLHVSERTVYRLADSGYIERVQVAPNTVRIRPDSVQRHIERGYTPPGETK